MGQQDSMTAQPGVAHETDEASGRRALSWRRRSAAAVAVVLALILSVVALISAQPTFLWERVVGMPGAPSMAQSPTPSATPLAEAPGPGWSQSWALPIPAAQRDGANPTLAWSPALPQTLYLCLYGQPLSTTTPASPHARLLFRSQDGGESWRALTTPEPTSRCAIYPDPTVAGRIALVDDHDNAYLSSDAGDAWQAIPQPPTAATYGSRFEAVVAGRVYVGADWTSDLHRWTRWFFGSPAASCSRSAGFYGSPLGGIDAVRDDGVIYSTLTPADGDTRPSGVIVYRNGVWRVVAPAPLRANPYAPPSVMWLPLADGRYTLLAVSDSALYRYDATVAP